MFPVVFFPPAMFLSQEYSLGVCGLQAREGEDIIALAVGTPEFFLASVWQAFLETKGTPMKSGRNT